MKLSGYTITRNAFNLDYPVELTIKSLLPVCDEVVVCDSDSTDGTRAFLDRWAEREPKLRVINWVWHNPVGQPGWFCEWLNFTRGHLSFDTQLQLDSDEVLHDSPACHAAVRAAVGDDRSRVVWRLNYWGTPFKLIPEGHCCGRYVTRIGPTGLYMPSDEPRQPGECPILEIADKAPDIFIHHLGFLRHQDAFFRKSKVVQAAFFGGYDERLTAAEKHQRPWWKEGCEFLGQLENSHVPLPELILPWLRERGHAV